MPARRSNFEFIPQQTYEQLKTRIEAVARFESLVQMPSKKDPDWPNWVARATVDGNSVNGQGDTDLDAMEDLLNKLTK
jgi:hypothetical protein